MPDISEFLDQVKQRELAVKNLIILQHGKKVVAHDWCPDAKANIYSASKSITSAAVGLAVKQGLLSLDEYVTSCFPDELPSAISNNMKKMKLIHLITMTMGFDAQYLMGNSRPALRETEPDWIRFSLSRPVIHEPGTSFLYSNIGPYLLGVLIERRSGMRMMDFLGPQLFEPLHIKVDKCEQCPQGYFFGAGGMELSCAELSRFGELYLNYGEYEGKRILSREWVEASSTMFSHQEGPDTSLLSEAELAASRRLVQAEDDEELGNHYGYFFWVIDDKRMFLARGKYGQFCVVCRDQGAVITVTSDERKDPHMVMRLVRRYLIPVL